MTFHYPDNIQPSLSNINLRIRPGEKVVILGDSGAGKSTLLHLIAGLYQPQEGNLIYDKIPIRSLNLEELRSEIGDCLSQEQIFEGSLLENITMGREAATMENVHWAVEKIGLEEFIKSLPDGFHTQLRPLGKTLARSIVQQIILARAIVDKPRLILLEYAFENLSADLRKPIIDFLTSGEHDWTIVAVSRDTYFASKSDKVVALDDGRIIFKGIHKDFKANSKNK